MARIASIALVAASLLIIPVLAVGAEGDVNEFFEFYDQGDLVTQDKYGFALLNLYAGLSEANVALRFRGDARLYAHRETSRSLRVSWSIYYEGTGQNIQKKPDSRWGLYC